MNETKRTSAGSDCAPSTDPADQPYPPAAGGCTELPTSPPPTLADPTKCPEPDPCKCPPGPGSTPNCLEDLINEQAGAIAAAEKAKTFKTDLEALLAKAKAAAQEYNRDKYQKLIKLWTEQDADIAELIRKLVCAVPCWRCVIECYVCPMINQLRNAEQQLYGDGTLYPEVHNLYDLQYWHSRNKDARERTFNRIKSVLAAWEKPAQTIDKVLADDAKLIADVNKMLGTDAGKAVYDVFLRLVPMHLAIAPPRDTAWKTKIGKVYTEFCKCDIGSPDNCCGPDVGPASLRQRLVGWQPYLVDPNDYFKIICCLVEQRYGPAKDALSQAESDALKVDNQIKRARSQVDDGIKSFDKDARGGIPSVIECCEDQIKTEPKPSQAS